jgi:meso-butanediol dehydrogenase / (S,S)-butanediol dehydrogenase / diacetyl reductase
MTEASGKVAAVTGAGRGIGHALAIGFARAGYDVAITDLPSQARELAATKAAIEALERKSWAETMDISIKPDVDASFSRVLHNAEKIDVLVNNAGILKPSTLEALSEKDWDAHMNVNAKGVLLCCQAVLPSMRRRKSGRIINIASIAGRQGVATQGHYAATKAAVITLTRVLAQEVGADGINVNAICPGIILTEMGKNNLGSDEAIHHWEQVAALKRLGAPEDIVGPALFFASDQSAFVTGQALNVCGGIYFH